jgi:phage terminase large subunit GpA-like protein
LLQVGLAYAIMVDPSPIYITHMGQTKAKEWVQNEVAPMIRNSPDLHGRLGRKVGDDNIFAKNFVGGCRLGVGWPTAENWAGRTSQFEMITDLDRMKPDIDGEGPAFGLATKRTETLGSRGMAVAESSPGYPVLNDSWVPGSPHELPPCDGIVGLYNGGTRGRWYWQCLDCSELFEPRIDRLHYDSDLPPAQAGAAAMMVCPHCGSLIAADHKVELNRLTLQGRGGWRHETDDGALVRVDDTSIRSVSRLSYHLNGAAAAFASWASIVTRLEVAKRSAAVMGEERDMQVVFNTDIGLPFRPTLTESEGVLSLQKLRAALQPLPRGTAPDWVRFITISVDVQGHYFAAQVMGWGIDGTRCIIDRFDLSLVPADAPAARDRVLDPGRYFEDWAILDDLHERVYPVQGSEFGLRPVALVVDFQGTPGVSDNAEKFLRARRKEGLGSVWFVSRGWGGFNHRRRVWYEAPERGSNGKRARSIKILNVAVDRLKDSTIAALGQQKVGVGGYVLSDWLSEEQLTEFTAEYRTAKKWEKRRGMVRNESLDLSVQGLALAEHKGLLRIDPENPPNWAIVNLDNEFAVAMKINATGDAKPVVSKSSAPSGAVNSSIKWLRR